MPPDIVIHKHLLNFKTLKSKNGRDRSQTSKASKEVGGMEAEVVYVDDSFVRFGKSRKDSELHLGVNCFLCQCEDKEEGWGWGVLRCWAE